jgi:NAD(P)-dependent dehydrogenase (short-subunit alcohol dehydrogenase family)
MDGKVVVITGATNGIGEAAALELARQGARLALVGRSAERAAAAVERIRRLSGNTQVAGYSADLASQGEVRRLAAELRRDLPRLDVLANNAGAFYTRRQLSPDGLELTFALNHLAYFLLTGLLLDLLKDSAPARVVNVSSAMHRSAPLDFADLQSENAYDGWMAYGRSKLCNLYFTYELAHRLEGSQVTANALHPGFVATHFGLEQRDGPPHAVTGGRIPTAEGADTLVYLASSPEVQGVSGKYFDQRRAVASSEASYDRAAAHRLWEISARLTGQYGGGQ